MRNGISRRHFLASAGALGASAALLGAMEGSDASMAGASTRYMLKNQTAIALQLDWIENVEFAGWWIAEKRGFYSQSGIDASFLNGQTADVEQIVSGGAAPIGIGSLVSAITDANKSGAGLVIYGAQYQDDPDCIISLSKNPIRKPHDIIGKTIGVQQGGTEAVNTILKIAGLPLDYTSITVGYDPTPLTQGACDGYLAFVTNQVVTLKLQGLNPVVATFGDLGYNQYAGLLISTKKWIDENHEALVAHTEATIKGWEINMKDPSTGVTDSMEVGANLLLDRRQQTVENQLQIPLMESTLTKEKGLFWVDKETISGPIYERLEKSGRKNLPSVDSLIDLSILQDVYNGKNSLLT